MTPEHSDDRHRDFVRSHESWQKHTEALPLRKNRKERGTVFEIDLDHLIDYVRPVAADAASGSTQFDYPKVAAAYMDDLERVQIELEQTPLSAEDRKLYVDYVGEFRSLLQNLSSLPVPVEGHLGFRASALEAFRFLTEQYHFKLVETSPVEVQFRSSTMSVRLSYWPQNPIGSVEIAQCDDDREKAYGFTLDDIAYAAGLGVRFDYDQFDLKTPRGIAEFLEAAASLLRRTAGALLEGDPTEKQVFLRKAEERERRYIETMEQQNSA